MQVISYSNLGLIDYKTAWDFQKKCFVELIDAKQNKSDSTFIYNRLLFCEHNPVYTLGRHGDINNLLFSKEQINAMGADFFEIERGGDITYHGPGQITGYTLWDLDSLGMGIKRYIEGLEESIISFLADYNLQGSRIKEASGVWLDAGKPGRERKICAVGVKASHNVTMHGFALNVNTDLAWFQKIVPCGIMDKGVTSLEKETGIKHNFEEIKQQLVEHIAKTFNFEVVEEKIVLNNSVLQQ